MPAKPPRLTVIADDCFDLGLLRKSFAAELGSPHLAGLALQRLEAIGVSPITLTRLVLCRECRNEGRFRVEVITAVISGLCNVRCSGCPAEGTPVAPRDMRHSVTAFNKCQQRLAGRKL